MADTDYSEIMKYHTKMVLAYIIAGVALLFPSLYVANQTLGAIGAYPVGILIVAVTVWRAGKHQIRIEELDNGV